MPHSHILYKRIWGVAFMFWKKKIIYMLVGVLLAFSITFPVKANLELQTPSAILIEASTGQVIFEKEASVRMCPASITKIMTLLLVFEQIEAGAIKLDDQVLVSNYASSMGGSQVYLAEGEIQTLDTMIKCITVASGNDASVAVAEHIAGSEAAFVDMMNAKALQLGMLDTHFMDCCGLTDSDEHFTTARDVALMSRELTVKYPQIFEYTKIWMEDITHETRQGVSNFTLSSTNKLLKQYQWATGLKTGSTKKAKYCISATASRDGIDLIAVIMGAPDTKQRFLEAQALLSYGFGNCKIYIDKNQDILLPLKVDGGILEEVPIHYESEFRYLDTEGKNLGQIERQIQLPKKVTAPIQAGEEAGYIKYMLEGTEIGRISIVFDNDIEKADFIDYMKKTIGFFLL